MSDLVGRTIENPVIQDIATFTHTAKETHEEKSVLEVRLHPGGGTPLHFHTEFEEIFTVLEGELVVQIRKEKRTLRKGESITIKRGDVHRFYSDLKGPVVFLNTIAPAHEGFENAIAIGYGLATDGRVNKKGMPKKLSHLIIGSALSGTYLTAPPRNDCIDPLLPLKEQENSRGAESPGRHLLQMI